MKRKREKVRVIQSNGELRKFLFFQDTNWDDSFLMFVDEFEDIVYRQEQNKKSTAPAAPQYLIQDNYIEPSSSKRHQKMAPLPEIAPMPEPGAFGFTKSDLARLFSTPAPMQQMPCWTIVPGSSAFSYSNLYPVTSAPMERPQDYYQEAEVYIPYDSLPDQQPLPSLEDIGDSDEQEKKVDVVDLTEEEEELASALYSLTDENNHDAVDKEKEHPETTASRQHSFFSSRGKGKERIQDTPTPLSETHKEKLRIMQELGIDNMTPEDYIPSPLDKNNLVFVDKVDVLKGFDGRGLFAKEDIPAGTCIGVYTGKVFASKKLYDQYLAEHPSENNNYAMNLGSQIVDGAIQGNFTRFGNYSDVQDNASFQPKYIKGKKMVVVVTTKNIRRGHQILINYNEYQPEISRNYRFLNPEDKPRSAQELYDRKSRHYELVHVDQTIELLKLEKDEALYASSIGQLVLANKPLPKKLRSPVDRPFLRTNSQHEIVDFDKADVFTPLMLACYLGQFGNVQTLVKHRANVDRQQHESGNCPLFFALEGYATQTTITKRRTYLRIITHLIDHDANIATHDRKDRTFLHKAASILSTKDFESLIGHLHQKHSKDFTQLFNYVDEDNFDIVLYCLSIKALDKAKMLLELRPKSFNENCIRRSKEYIDWYCQAFQQAIEHYDEHEKENLLELLQLYDAPEVLVDMLNIPPIRETSPAF